MRRQGMEFELTEEKENELTYPHPIALGGVWYEAQKELFNYFDIRSFVWQPSGESAVWICAVDRKALVKHFGLEVKNE